MASYIANNDVHINNEDHKEEKSGRKSPEDHSKKENENILSESH